MKRTLAFLAAGLVGGALLSYFLFATPDGLSQREARELAREAGDSAVAAFRTSGEMEALLAGAVGDAIRDTVDYYDARVRVAGIIEIRHDTVRVTDTLLVNSPSLVRVLRWEPIHSNGVQIVETTYFDPGVSLQGVEVTRHIELGIMPDTLAVALLRMGNGLERLTALLNGTGEVVVIDAAVYDPGPTTFDRLTRYVGIGGCVAAGFQLGRLAAGVDFSTGDWVVAGGGGALCAVKALTW